MKSETFGDGAVRGSRGTKPVKINPKTGQPDAEQVLRAAKKTLSKPVPEEFKGVIEGIQDTANELFKKSGYLAQTFFGADRERRELQVGSFPKPENPELHDGFFRLLRELRNRFPFSAWITEVWTVARAYDTPPQELIVPSECPDRKEVALLQCVFNEPENRTIVYVADIQRNPNRLGEWLVMSDSFDGAVVEGRAFRAPNAN